MTQPLITRLSKLDAPDREVDAEIEVAVRRIEAARSGLAEEYWANWQASPDGTVYDTHTRYPSKPYTASVDAAIALAEKVLPGWTWSLFPHAAEIRHPKIRAKDQMAGGFNTATALCIALLRAKEASK